MSCHPSLSSLSLHGCCHFFLFLPPTISENQAKLRQKHTWHGHSVTTFYLPALVTPFNRLVPASFRDSESGNVMLFLELGLSLSSSWMTCSSSCFVFLAN